MRRAAWLWCSMLAGGCNPAAPAPVSSASSAPSALQAPASAAVSAAAPQRPLTVGELQMFVPAVLAGLERKNVNVLAAAGVVTGHYEGGGRRADVTLHLLADLGSVKTFYEASYPTRAKLEGEVVYTRLQPELRAPGASAAPSGAPSSVAPGAPLKGVAEACVILRERLNVCATVSLALGGEEAVPFLQALELPKLAKRAEAR